jgi:hypothetical protein
LANSIGDAYDNALAETKIGLFKTIPPDEYKTAYYARS